MNYEELKDYIDQKVYENTGQEITGTNLNLAIKEAINVLGQGYQYMGIAHPDDPASTYDSRVFFFASEGTYLNYDNIVVGEGELAILKFDEEWSKDSVLTLEGKEIENTEEAGFFVTDPSMNVGMQYTEDGLDFAKIADHAVRVLKTAGIGADVEFIGNTEEAGFFVVDSELNIGAKVDEDGVHAKNILEYEIVEE